MVWPTRDDKEESPCSRKQACRQAEGMKIDEAEKKTRSNISMILHVPTAMAEICGTFAEYATVFQDASEQLVDASEQGMDEAILTRKAVIGLQAEVAGLH